MSVKLNSRHYNFSANDTSIFLKIDKNEEKVKLPLPISHFESTKYNLNNFIKKDISDSSPIKKKIDKLNLKFNIESDKFLNSKNEMEKCQDNLFSILFKQIKNYVGEIDYLNLKLKEKEDSEKLNKFKQDEIFKNNKEVLYFKNTIRNLEKKVNDNKITEDKLKNENDSFRRQLQFYKDKLKLELNGKKDKENLIVNNINNNYNNENYLINNNPIAKKYINSGLNSTKTKKTEFNLKLDINSDLQIKNEKIDNIFNIFNLADEANININKNIIRDNNNNSNTGFSNNSKYSKNSKTSKYTEIEKKKHLNNYYNINKEINKKNFSKSANRKEFGKNNNINKNNIINISQNNEPELNLNIISYKKKESHANKNKNYYPNLIEINNNKLTESVVITDPTPTNETSIIYNFNNNLNEFANLLSDNIKEELDLLYKEEEVLLFLKNNILLNNLDDEDKFNDNKECIYSKFYNF